MNRIKEIWTELKKQPDFLSGLAKIRYSESSYCDLYLGIKLPENSSCLILGLPISVINKINSDRKLRGLRLEKVDDSQHSTRGFLNLILLDNRFSDIFDSLILDIIRHIINLDNEGIIAREFLNRIDKWQALFEKAASEGLPPEAQRGLFGELYFLRKWLDVAKDKAKCLQAWVGPELAVRDFEYGGAALEVKTTKGNNHQKIQISSERQLDVTTLDYLFLFHLSLDVQQNAGEALSSLVESVKALLIHDFNLYTVFQEKLLQAGYYQSHQHLYAIKSYKVRQESFYEVKGDFPRIQENEVREGVGDIKYSIILSNYSDYLVDEQVVFNTLN
ncbi:PD-(D/E)XK motif protein [Rufibacter sediminis]|uniref:PD-(D/E)XK motif protein n=1 Tax=Rufibacter sediminis TaxID=2762756 RepID=A0ABR6VQZ0_9BACT|nr:PD-(D/E)XK motif protein [Rufibacter sediminis]MBC3539577.1 PD-(D/E)XK motif protein [Rufibacter sediminis]